MKLKDKRCPDCAGSCYVKITVGHSAYDGRPLELPSLCQTCGGTGFVSTKDLDKLMAAKRFRAKLLDAQRLAHRALRSAR